MADSKIIAFLSSKNDLSPDFLDAFKNDKVLIFENGFEYYQWIEASEKSVDMIIAKGRYNSPNCKGLLTKLKADDKLGKTTIIFILTGIDNAMRKEAIIDGVNEIFDEQSTESQIIHRIQYLLENPPPKLNGKKKQEASIERYKMPFIKRVFDIFFSAIALILLSPLFLIIALAIRFESKGPIFYYSMRVGTGYHIFKFYKFRSMYTGADAKLKELSHLNQYKAQEKIDEEDDQEVHHSKKEGVIEIISRINKDDEQMLYMDGKAITEEEYAQLKKKKEAGTFIKIKNDPRITKVGKFIRNTSIDELPQLFNVLIGDMSIVGNRPLPLYEAEKLTTDRFSLRFIAPAGITGLWQVTKRGKGEMSEEERMQLDNDYANNFSIWQDILIILKTIPALLQKEDV
tara:strand:+ start:5556 stop:6758 length:1203 start_codon:yes stop_codon:yes gene_type:complete